MKTSRMSTALWLERVCGALAIAVRGFTGVKRASQPTILRSGTMNNSAAGQDPGSGAAVVAQSQPMRWSKARSA
jgi:hypothetical protein